MDATNNEPKMIARKPRAPRAKKPVAAKPAPNPPCCLCGGLCDCPYGHNPAPLTGTHPGDTCCNSCNATKVIPARFAAIKKQEEFEKSMERWNAKDITVDELLVTDAAAADVLANLRAEVDHDDDMLGLLVRNHHRTYAWYLYGPHRTFAHSSSEAEAEAVMNMAEVDSATHAWGYQVNKRHGCLLIYCGSQTAYDCWRAYLNEQFGHGGELHDPKICERVWND